MASFKGEIKSKVLDMDIALNVILPYDHPKDKMSRPCKVLYLLHGLSSSSASWMRWTSIERYAMKHGIAVIMPEVQRSFYANMVYGLDYFTFVADELPQLCADMFCISTKREDSYVAGLSMGGYGALKLGLTYPKRYCSIGSFSGSIDMKRILDKSLEYADNRRLDEMKGILGLEMRINPQDDILHLAREHAKLPESQRCDIFATCGTEDEIPELYSSTKDFLKLLDNLGIKYEYQEWPGTHEWGFWDASVAKYLNYLFGE